MVVWSAVAVVAAAAPFLVEDLPLEDFLDEDLLLEPDFLVEALPLEADLPLEAEALPLEVEAFLPDLPLDFLAEVFCLEDDLVLVGVVYPEAAAWSVPLVVAAAAAVVDFLPLLWDLLPEADLPLLPDLEVDFLPELDLPLEAEALLLEPDLLLEAEALEVDLLEADLPFEALALEADLLPLEAEALLLD